MDSNRTCTARSPYILDGLTLSIKLPYHPKPSLKPIERYMSIKLHLVLLLKTALLLLSFISVLNALMIPYYEVVNLRMETKIFHIVLSGSGLVDTYISFLLLITSLFITFGLTQKSSLLRKICIISALTVLPLEHLVNGMLSNLVLFGAVLLSVLDFFQRIRMNSMAETRDAIVLFITYIVAAVSFVEGVAAIYWLLYPSALGSILLLLPQYFAEIELQFFSIFSELSPLLLLVLLLLPFIALLQKRDKSIYRPLLIPEIMLKYSRFLNPFLFAVAILTSILAARYPLAPGLNPDLAFFSVDFREYLAVLDKLVERGFSLNLCWPDRILSHVVMYGFYSVSGLSTTAAIAYLPAMLGPLFVIATYLTARELPHGKILAGFASYLAATSYTITVGIYAGFYANWLANIIATLFMGLFLRWNRTRTMLAYTSMVGSTLMLLLAHQYTWSLLMGGLFCYLVINSRRYFQTRIFSGGGYILILLLTNIVADLLRSSILSSESAYQLNSSLLISTLSVGNLLELNRNLVITFHQFAAGFLASFAVLLLSILSLSSRLDSELHRLFSCTLGLSAFLILLGDVVSVQSRVLYVLPFPLMCTLGFLNLTSAFHGFWTNRRLADWLFTLILTVVCLVQFNYVLRSMGTLTKLLA